MGIGGERPWAIMPSVGRVCLWIAIGLTVFNFFVVTRMRGDMRAIEPLDDAPFPPKSTAAKAKSAKPHVRLPSARLWSCAHMRVPWVRAGLTKQPLLQTLGFGFQRQETERRHPTGRERMGSPTLQTLQNPILLLPGLLSNPRPGTGRVWTGEKPTRVGCIRVGLILKGHPACPPRRRHSAAAERWMRWTAMTVRRTASSLT